MSIFFLKKILNREKAHFFAEISEKRKISIKKSPPEAKNFFSNKLRLNILFLFLKIATY